MSTLLDRCRSRRLSAAVTAACVSVVLASCADSSNGDRASDGQARERATSGNAPRSTPSETTTPDDTATVDSESTQPADATEDTADDPVTPAPSGWVGGPSDAEMRRAAELVGSMTVRERAGQVVVASYSGTSPPDELVRQHHLGGVILLEENVGDARTLPARLSQLQSSSERSFPLWIGVDQEGGVVQRLGAPFTAFGPYMAQGAASDDELSTDVAHATASELRAAGFTSVFAPVADVTTGLDDPTIGSRSAGDRPGLVSRTVAASQQGYKRGGVVSVLKHFPGHGSVPADSHDELPIQDASLRHLRQRDLVPFEQAVGTGAPAIMSAHIAVQAVDPGVPSSLSRPMITGLLRGELGYAGVVVTDALNMAGVTAAYDTREAPVRALRAGNDVLLMPPDPVGAIDAVRDAVRSGSLPSARLTQAATRMVGLLLQQESAAELQLRSHPAVLARQARAVITSVSGPCRGRLVGTSVDPTGGTTAVAAFTRAAHAAGLPVDADAGDTVALLGYGEDLASADVVVATDTPYILGQSDAPVKLATFGDGPAQMRALVDVLLGEQTAPGRLPVRVDGLSRNGC
jgi:beta-N-acetylhexosaminidase